MKSKDQLRHEPVVVVAVVFVVAGGVLRVLVIVGALTREKHKTDKNGLKHCHYCSFVNCT